MKANRPQIERALKSPGAARMFLFHGPDDAGSRALLAAFRAAAGAEAERIVLTGAELKDDSGRLAVEAASMSLFGGSRIIVVDPAGDEAAPAVEALLRAPRAGNPVAILAGTLKATSKLLKLALAAPDALACISYLPDDKDLARLVTEMSRGHGLTMSAPIARMIGDAAAGNRALIDRELEKYALYLDAAPDRPRALDSDAIAAVGAGNKEGDQSRLVDAVAGGNASALRDELMRLGQEGIEGITVLRAMVRRMALLARLRAEVDRGASVSAVMASHGRAIFFREKDGVTAQLGRWRGDAIARCMSRLLDAERRIKASGALGSVAADEELFAICRQAARLR